MKGERCYSPKCAMVKKPYPPGLHGKRRRSLSEYGKQLLEKQRIRNTYGVMERQFRKYIEEVGKKAGDKREMLFKRLEKRLDNVIYRSGFAKSRKQARQFISHNYFQVNGRRMNIPSYEVKVGDVIKLKEKSQSFPLFKDLREYLKKYQFPHWLSVNVDKMEIKVASDVPMEEAVDLSAFGMIIEFYSR